MDCEKFDRVVLDLLYDELDELTRAAALRHLEHCARCGPIVNGLRATREVGVIPLVDPPPGLERRILEAERRARAGLPWRQRLGRAVSIVAGYAMRPQLAMAALLLLMIGSSLLVLRSHPSDQGRVKESGVPEVEGETLGASRAFPAAPSIAGYEAAASAGVRAATPPSESGTFKAKRGFGPEPADDYERAMAAYREGRFAEAERGFGAVAAARGSNAASAALLAVQARRDGSGCASAASQFDEVASHYRGSSIAQDAAWQAAECYRELGMRERAEQRYRELARTPAYQERALAALETITPKTVAVARSRPAAKARAPAAPAAERAEAASPAAVPPPAPEPNVAATAGK